MTTTQVAPPRLKAVRIGTADLALLREVLGSERFEAMMLRGVRAAKKTDSTTWNVNSTARGGGVAEMLPGLLALLIVMGFDVRWVVIEGFAEFYELTKRLHNRIHGFDGDGGPLGEKEREIYLRATHLNRGFLDQVREGDTVIVHDPQPAGLMWLLRMKFGDTIKIVWRCHVGTDTPNELSREAWAFLAPFLVFADRFVFSRREFVPNCIPADKVTIIQPGLDPTTPKNAPMSDELVDAVLSHIGVTKPTPGAADIVAAELGWHNGAHRGSAVLVGELASPDVPVVLQVSRWDRLKDMPGVMRGFIERVLAAGLDAHNVLCGPDISGVTDDPEGKAVLDECTEIWKSLPAEHRARITLVCLPMGDTAANAWMVNALQRHAKVITQKSTAEGYGLTVTEAMYKGGGPVVGSAVGGINDQIVHGETGMLVSDPTDTDEFGDIVHDLLRDEAFAEQLRKAGQEFALANGLPDRQLEEWGNLLHHLHAEWAFAQAA